MAAITSAAPATTLKSRQLDWWGFAFLAGIIFCLVACFAFLFALLGSVLGDGMTVLSDRGADFITSDLSTVPEDAGVWQAIKGSLMLAGFVVVIAFPLGIATAIYLEEYARDNRFTRLVALNIRNLAGVPSVVYGLLGLAVFVEFFGTDWNDSGGLTGGRTLLAGGLTLAILVLPIVIITSAEAIRAVPSSLREGGYGLGAAQSDVVRRIVLPNAAAGILTGTILSLSRALGETAPLILTGAVISNFFTSPDGGFVDTVKGDYTALPVAIFNFAGEAKVEYKEQLAPAAILVLLGVTLMCNAVAVLLRNRYDKDR